MALGRIAHETFVCGARQTQRAVSVRPRPHAPLGALTLFDSYHCSRYNTNTGVLTPQCFASVFAKVRAHLGAAQA